MADPVSNRLKQLRMARGWSLAQLGEMIGTSGQNVSKIELGKARLTLDWVTKFARAFDIDPLELMRDESPTRVAATPVAATPERLPISQQSVDRNDLIPVRSAGRGGNGQTMFLSDGPIDYARRPMALQTARDAYAVYMVGDSMSPRYEPGWLLYVHPFKPPTRGRAVVVTLRNDIVLVKEWVSQDATTLTLRQLKPAEELRFPLAEVRDIHLVVGSTEE
jgi:phage repressor protein C with HTH and peptisase S24 domain